MSQKDIRDLERDKFDRAGNVKISFAGEYAINDYEEVSLISYVGKSNGSDYVIEEITETPTGLTKRYARIEDNLTILTYSDAWTNRDMLTYSLR